MAHLIECVTCKTLMADSVRRCPHCNRPTGVGMALWAKVGIAVAVALVVVGIVLLTR